MLLLYTNKLSTNCHKVQYLLEELHIPYKTQNVDLFKGEHQSFEFTKKNPFGAVPLIDDGGFCLSESNAIVKYLALRYGKGSWYPKDMEASSRVDQMVDFVTQHIGRHVSTISWNQVVVPLMKLPSQPQQVEEAHKSLTKYLGRFEHALQSQLKTTIEGKTIADAVYLPFAQQMMDLNVSIKDFPHVEKYTHDLLQRPLWKKVHAEASAWMKELSPKA